MQLSLWLIGFLPLAFGAILSTRDALYSCNNSPDLCARAYSNITFLGAHDSPFVTSKSASSTTFTDAANQNVNSTAQLSAGVRLLSAQVHRNEDAWHLCHTSCDLLDAGPLSSWLSEIKQWMDQNPHDIVTILLVNSDGVTAQQLHAEFETANLTSYAYAPSTSSTTWPTLNEMIMNGTRLVTFVEPLVLKTPEYPYLLSEFDNVFENNYNVTSLTGFSCTADRPSNVEGQTAKALSAGLLPLVNHFLYTTSGFGIQTPDTGNITTTNGLSGTGSLGEAASSCSETYGRAPSFFLVDYFDQGSALQVVDDLNGIKATARTPTLTNPIASTGPSSGTSLTPSNTLSLQVIVFLLFALGQGINL